MITKTLKSLAFALLIGGILGNSALAGQVPQVVGTPGTYGDQLLFFYDARTDRVPFLTISNLAVADIEVEILYYGQDLKGVLAGESKTIPALGNIVVDPSKVNGVGGNAGLAIVTPVAAPEGPIAGGPGVPTKWPVVPPAAGIFNPTPPLFGSFTLANTQLGAGFGQNPMGRIAVTPRGDRAKTGTFVDGRVARYQQIGPEALIVPTYFRPADLSPASKDGNRIILGSFKDDYGNGSSYRVRPGGMVLDAFFDDASGKNVAEKRNLLVDGIHLDTLEDLAGKTLQSSGKILFGSLGPLDADQNLFGLVAQALGTFAVGQQMPGIFLTDQSTEKLVFPLGVASGDLGGITAADASCQHAADAEGLPGNYYAWLSDSSTSPAARFTKSQVPYVLLDGTRIADDWQDLTDGTLNGLSQGIWIRPGGVSFARGEIFTNTDASGNAVDATPSGSCGDWKNKTGLVTVGDTNEVSATWTNRGKADCGAPAGNSGIYCFQQ